MKSPDLPCPTVSTSEDASRCVEMLPDPAHVESTAKAKVSVNGVVKQFLFTLVPLGILPLRKIAEPDKPPQRSKYFALYVESAQIQLRATQTMIY